MDSWMVLMVPSTVPCILWPDTGQVWNSIPLCLCSCSCRSRNSSSLYLKADNIAGSWSQKIIFGTPASQDNLVTPSTMPAELSFSNTWRLTALVVMHTAVITQTFASRTCLFLVLFSNPGTNTVRGPNRSSWQAQKAGAMFSWWSEIGPISTCRSLFLLFLHTIHSSLSSLNRFAPWMIFTCSKHILFSVSTPLCFPDTQWTCWAMAYDVGECLSRTGTCSLRPKLPSLT